MKNWSQWARICREQVQQKSIISYFHVGAAPNGSQLTQPKSAAPSLRLAAALLLPCLLPMRPVACRVDTRLHDQPCDVKKALANSEPSTHGAKRKWAGGRVRCLGRE